MWNNENSTPGVQWTPGVWFEYIETVIPHPDAGSGGCHRENSGLFIGFQLLLG